MRRGDRTARVAKAGDEYVITLRVRRRPVDGRCSANQRRSRPYAVIVSRERYRRARGRGPGTECRYVNIADSNELILAIAEQYLRSPQANENAVPAAPVSVVRLRKSTSADAIALKRTA